MSIDSVKTDVQKAMSTAEQIEQAAKDFEDAIAQMEAGVTAVEGRSNAEFIQNFRDVITEFKNGGVADAVAKAKANAVQTKETARLQDAESKRDIQI